MLLRNQPTPIDPTTNAAMDINKVSTLMKMLKIAVVGEVNETYETYVFRTRVQKETETIDEFVTILRELVQTCGLCEHESMKDKFIRDQIIFGIRDAALREKLLQERSLSLKKCLDVCRADPGQGHCRRCRTDGGKQSGKGHVEGISQEGSRWSQGDEIWAWISSHYRSRLDW